MKNMKVSKRVKKRFFQVESEYFDDKKILIESNYFFYNFIFLKETNRLISDYRKTWQR